MQRCSPEQPEPSPEFAGVEAGGRVGRDDSGAGFTPASAVGMMGYDEDGGEGGVSSTVVSSLLGVCERARNPFAFCLKVMTS